MIKRLIIIMLIFIGAVLGGEQDLEIPQEGLVVLNFWAEWCDDCLEISTDFPNLDTMGAPVIHINVDENYEMALDYGLESLPYIVFLLDGEIVWEMSGNVKMEIELDRDQILEQIELFLGEEYEED